MLFDFSHTNMALYVYIVLDTPYCRLVVWYNNGSLSFICVCNRVNVCMCQLSANKQCMAGCNFTYTVYLYVHTALGNWNDNTRHDVWFM